MEKNIPCINTVDYSTMMADRILPYRFVLNLEKSILQPEMGQYQKFCYDVEAVGQDTESYADLSYFIFGICNEITQNDLKEISVIKDGKTQMVIYGENVGIISSNTNPYDTLTGLKFNFPLSKTNGTIEVCFSLLQPYPIGPIELSLYGESTLATGLKICGPINRAEAPCSSVFYQTETVCLPVTVTPYAHPGEASAHCCGSPIINHGGKCSGTQASCSFTVTQNLCIEIPIEFGAVIETGNVAVQCGAEGEGICDCSSAIENSIFNRK